MDASASDSVSGTALFSISESAAKRVAFLMSQEEKPVFLRVTVSGGGCSGFQYGFAFDEERKNDDEMIERDGAVVAVDSMSLLYMTGAEIDYVEDLIGAAFSVKNPNATASCGCGTSFSI